MSITYPLTFPTSIKLASVAPVLTFMNSSTKSPFTMERQAFRWPGEAWAFDYTTAPCERDVAEDWIAFANKLRGNYGTFLLGDASAPALLGVGGGTPLVDGAISAGVYDLPIKGAPNSTTGWLLKGTYIQVGTGATSRLHKLVENADTNGAGKVTLQIVPAIRADLTDGAAVVISNAKGVFHLVDNAVAWNVDSNGHYRYTFRAEEAL